MKRKFDTQVQDLKYRVIKEVARQAFADTLYENIYDIPRIIHPTKIPTIRCCVYKEREILSKRVKLAMGGNKSDQNPIEVIDVACDECPAAGYVVTEMCRGCLAHKCGEACKRGAISFDSDHSAHIDKSKCVECGACARVCPFFAIINRKRPCQIACKVKAISINDENIASVDSEKCIACGACVYQCPFGAIMDKSYILKTIDLLKAGRRGESKLYAVIAPAIASQFEYATLGQVVRGLKELGFRYVVEAALGADMVAKDEAAELAQKGFLTSSCCPAFVSYIKKSYPEMLKYVSHNLSPMATVSKYIKEHEEGAKVVFIGPCTAKKAEVELPEVKPYVDSVLTFEELQALFDSCEIEIDKLEECELADASVFGRTFARSGGVALAVSQGLREIGSDFELRPCVCNGIEECRVALAKKAKNMADFNFIEGMACEGGCIGGAGCLTHGETNRTQVDEYAGEGKKRLSDAIEGIKIGRDDR